MGHMLNQTEMDILTRWHRMFGDTAVWVPGTDHAGIATQMMVERQLAAEGKKRTDFSREAFTERVWAWKQQYGGAITDQMRRLGASVDWSREYFTMDDRLSVAVKEAFVRLYEQGLIYRGAYIVNWDPMLRTAVSDLEVDTRRARRQALPHPLPLADGTGSIIIATTRPETMLGDIAVAVNPTDERYTALHRQECSSCRSVGREIPIVADDWANPEFGTGAVKVTPAHDPNDFAIGQRHNLPQPQHHGRRRRASSLAGSPYDGLDRFEARKRIVADLEAAGLLVAIKDHTLTLAHLAAHRRRHRAAPLHAVVPRRQQDAQRRRQLHRRQRHRRRRDRPHQVHPRDVLQDLLRVDEQHPRLVHLPPALVGPSHPRLALRRLRQASPSPATPPPPAPAAASPTSARRPTSSTPGSPPACCPSPSSAGTARNDLTPDLAAFYPTAAPRHRLRHPLLLGRPHDHARPHFMLDVPMPDGTPRTLADAVPFRDVYIHALVRDADRQKMSKTKGNVIDPIEIVTKYGTDAVRFTLASQASPGTDIAFNEARTEGYRAFANKIWNAARFLQMNIERGREAGYNVSLSSHDSLSINLPENTPLETRWIFSRLSHRLRRSRPLPRRLPLRRSRQRRLPVLLGRVLRLVPRARQAPPQLLPRRSRRLQAAQRRRRHHPQRPRQRLRSRAAPALALHALPHRRALARPLRQRRHRHPRKIHRPHPLPAGAQTSPPTQLAVARHDHPAGAHRHHPRPAQRTRRSRERSHPHPAPRQQPQSPRSRKPTPTCSPRLARVSAVELAPATLTGNNARSTSAFDVAVVYERQIDVPAERERLTKDLAKYTKGLEAADKQLGNEGFIARAPAHIVEGLSKQHAETLALKQKAEAALAALPPE